MTDPCTLLALPDELLSLIIASLPPRDAFRLSLTNTRLHHLFRTSYETLDLLTPFRCPPLYATPHLTALLNLTPNLRTLRLSTALPPLPPLPLRALAFDHSLAPPTPVLAHPTLRELAIRAPRPGIARCLPDVLPRLEKLALTDVPVDSPIIHHLLSLLPAARINHLTFSLSNHCVRAEPALARVLNAVRHHPTLTTLSYGVATPEAVSRTCDQTRHHRFFIRLTTLLKSIQKREKAPTPLESVHVFTPCHDLSLFELALPLSADALSYSFEANTIEFPTSGGCVITELASIPTMRYIPAMPGVNTNVRTYNLVLRELATGYTHEYIDGFRGIITPALHTLRAQIPLRSQTNLNPIAVNLRDIMGLSRVTNLHISREVIYFAEVGVMPSFLRRWHTIRELCLTAPEEYPQDPYPDRGATKFSAWRFMTGLPRFLEILKDAAPRLKTLLLEDFGPMGDVENPKAMTGLIEYALKAVARYEQGLPGADASTVRAQLIVWRNQFLQA